MGTRKEAETLARQLRKENKTMAVNVKEITRNNWGIRFSPKGTRDKYDYRKTGGY